MELKVGDAAPEIKLTTSEGKPFQLSAHRGRGVVLFFYPKANTPGCTTEACEFGTQAGAFHKRKTVIVGISPDKEKPQESFRSKFELPYSLLCDSEHAAAEAYGVWKEKSLYGRKYMGIERTTFVLDEAGRITAIYRKVKPAGHAAEVLAGLV